LTIIDKKFFSFKSVTELKEFGMAVKYFPCYRNEKKQFHKIDVTLVSVVVKGSCAHLIGNDIYKQQGPSIGITPRGTHHCIITNEPGIEVFNLFLDFDNLSLPLLAPELSDALLMLFPFSNTLNSNMTNRIFRVNLDGQESAIEVMFNLQREFARKQPGYTYVVHDILKIFLTGACRGVLNSGIKINADTTVPGQFRLERVRRRLDRDFRSEISLGELAKLAGLNPNYLCRKFRNYTGKTIFTYLLERRIQSAIRQLKQSNEKIAAIAYENGFNDLSHFNRSFRKITGQSPGSYRRQYK
jgi:AraC-like DNA-binding protein